MANRGLFGTIEDTMTSPLWLGGAALLTGEGMSGAMQGMRMGAGFRQQRRQQQEEEERKRRFQGLVSDPSQMQGINPAFLRVAQAAGPEQGWRILSDALLAKMKADRAAAGGGRVSLQPIYGVDAEGNPVVMQPTDSGRMIRSQMPEGVTVSRQPIKLDAGTHHVLLDPVTRQQIGIIPKDIAGAASQEVEGKAVGEARSALPGAASMAQEIEKQVQSLKEDPYLGRMLGPIDSRLPNVSEDAARVQAKLDQIQGGAFLQARQLLKGGGAITDFEGTKAEAAFARLNTAQSVKDFNEALDDFNYWVQQGVKKLEQQGRAGAPAAGPQTGSNDVEATRTIDGQTYVKIGGQWYAQ